MAFNKKSVCIIVFVFLLNWVNCCLAKPLQVVTITEDFASIASSIGGDLVNVSSLVKGSRNLHHIYPKPSTVIKMKKADVLIRLGLEQDKWVDESILAAKNKRIFQNKPGYIDASQKITVLEIPTAGELTGVGDIHAFGNPHYWLDPNNGKIIATMIKDRFSILDPENSDTYEKNLAIFVQQIDSKFPQWTKAMATLKDKEFVTYHKVWSYFFNVFDCNSAGELEPYPGVPPSAKHVAALKQSLQKSSQSTIVLAANYFPKTSITAFSKQLDAPLYFLSANVGEDGVSSYIELFDYLVQNLTQ